MTLRTLIATVFCLCLPIFADATPAKDQSVEKLLELTQEKQTYEMMTQIDALVGAGARQSAEAQGSPLSADQESAIQEAKIEMKAAMPYSAMHEIGLRVYRESFTEE